ncbi:hypothetical protein AG1IA_09834 [Rhizoctonia solani AG-1 IA]|uniref:Uncharacterized protein n=1 Tax=Thanatephorus cucumeris (strain AG1-IA) TaxID=983506 RepID=L8WD78_THACA|nr:hypothetical protein AG1IA_09834 [Rhizoctonia solani AG-1 IA]
MYPAIFLVQAAQGPGQSPTTLNLHSLEASRVYDRGQAHTHQNPSYDGRHASITDCTVFVRNSTEFLDWDWGFEPLGRDTLNAGAAEPETPYFDDSAPKAAE